MAILTITSGELSDLAVVKVTPANQDCFTLYQYIVTTNQSDSIDITLTGNHFEASYISNGAETSFSDTATVAFDTSLEIKFLLLNSGTTGVYSSATINITNTTTSNYYENFVERQDDTANCYDPIDVPTKTSDLLNDGATGVSTYVETTDLSAYLPLAGGTMSGTINMGGSETILDILSTEWTNQINANTISADFTNSDQFEFYPNPSGNDLEYNFPADEWRIEGSKIATLADLSATVGGIVAEGIFPLVASSTNTITHGLGYTPAASKIKVTGYRTGTVSASGTEMVVGNITSTTFDIPIGSLSDPLSAAWAIFGTGTVVGQQASEVSFDPYLTLGSTDVQLVIEELKDEVDLLGATTIDSVITDASTNPVENNAIYDEFQLVSYLASANTFTGATNTFDNTIIIDNTTDGLEIYNTASVNYIDTNAGGLVIKTDTFPTGWTFNDNGTLIGNSGTSIYSPIVTVDYDVYSSGWQGNLEVPTKRALYEKIEALSLANGDVTKVGTPVDDQVGVWTGDGTLEGTTGLTYDGTDLTITGNIVLTGTVDTIDIATDVAANTAKVTNATHTGDVTGDVALTIAAAAVDIPMLSASGTASSSTYLRGDNTWGTPAGSGDVTKVGTPVNNQVGIWTGDGTIEGDVDLTFDGDNLTVGGAVFADSIRAQGTGNNIRNFGSSTGTNNQSYNSFYESNGTVRQGYIGFGSASNSDLLIVNDVSGQQIKLVEGGGNNGVSFYDGAATRTIWHAGNDGAGSGLDADLVQGLDFSSSGNRWGVMTQVSSGGGVLEVGKIIDFHETDADTDDYDARIEVVSGDLRIYQDFIPSAINLVDLGTIQLPFRAMYTDFLGIMDSSDTVKGWTITPSPTTLAFTAETAAGSDSFTPTIYTLQNSGTPTVSTDLVNLGHLTIDEGSFSPALIGVTSGTYTSTPTANFYKIGRTCHFSILLSSVSGTTPTGALRITGLPYNAESLSLVNVEMTGSSVNFYSIHGKIFSGQSYIQFYYQAGIDGSNNTTMTNVDFTLGIITVTGSYITDPPAP